MWIGPQDEDNARLALETILHAAVMYANLPVPLAQLVPSSRFAVPALDSALSVRIACVHGQITHVRVGQTMD